MRGNQKKGVTAKPVFIPTKKSAGFHFTPISISQNQEVRGRVYLKKGVTAKPVLNNQQSNPPEPQTSIA
jgi:hypothetical protein